MRRKAALILLLCMLVMPRAARAGAVDAIAALLDAQDRAVYVYKDYADGQNLYTLRAWMGPVGGEPAVMDEMADPYSGITSIKCHMDFSEADWGGYTFLAGKLAQGSAESELSFGEVETGLDLMGAARLSFWARGEAGGEVVQFFCGGLGEGEDVPFPDTAAQRSTGYVALGEEWRRYEIDLGGADLRRMALGFGWAASASWNPDRSSIQFYLDEIQFEFDEPRHSPQFLQSYQSLPLEDARSAINSFAFVYDNAVAAIALTRAGYHHQARQIADAIVTAALHDRYFKDGRIRNAYSSGTPLNPLGWLGADGSRINRLALIFMDGRAVEDQYAVSTSAGNTAWAILALLDAYDNAPERADYLACADRLGEFELALRSDTGGFTAGREGFDETQVCVTHKSTEHNLDLIWAFSRLADATGREDYREASEWARSFVMGMYDADRHCFYTGTEADGVTIYRAVLPLDSNSWGVQALLPLGFEAAADVLAFAEREQGVGYGFDFDDDRDGVWLEGTAQMALCYRLMGMDEEYHRTLALLGQFVGEDGLIPAADRDGMTTGFNIQGLGETPWVYDKRAHLGATAWLALAQMGENPFISGK